MLNDEYHRVAESGAAAAENDTQAGQAPIVHALWKDEAVNTTMCGKHDALDITYLNKNRVVSCPGCRAALKKVRQSRSAEGTARAELRHADPASLRNVGVKLSGGVHAALSRKGKTLCGYHDTMCSTPMEINCAICKELAALVGTAHDRREHDTIDVNEIGLGGEVDDTDQLVKLLMSRAAIAVEAGFPVLSLRLSSAARALDRFMEQQRIEAILKDRNPDDYDDWMQTGFLLKATGITNVRGGAFAAWNEWSKKSSKYDWKTLNEKWVSFPRPDDARLPDDTSVPQAGDDALSIDKGACIDHCCNADAMALAAAHDDSVSDFKCEICEDTGTAFGKRCECQPK